MPSIACGVLMALRVLKHLGCLAEDSNTAEGWLAWVRFYQLQSNLSFQGTQTLVPKN